MARIAIVGEAWSRHDEETGRPFSGPSGRILNGLLRQVGINRDECLLTSVFNFRPPSSDIEALCGPRATAIPDYNFIRPGKYIRAEFAEEIARLFSELESFSPTLILALGNLPLWAICKKTGIKKYRGTPLLSHNGKWKVLPTWPPAALGRQWNLRPIAYADFSKAVRQAAFPEVVRPRREIWIEPSLRDIEDFYDQHIRGCTELSVDIETSHGQITEIGFAPSRSLALVIPFYSRSAPRGNYWPSAAEEKSAWLWVKRILAEKPCFGQNFLYDMDYLWKTMGITCPKQSDDTMLLHHALQPELEKGLGFLGSIYTDEPSWKFMRADNETLKKED